jgi:signal transduction histidine kinase
MDVGNKQTEGGCRTFDKGCRFVAIFGLKDLEPGLDELLGKDVTDQRFVFDNEDAQDFYRASADHVAGLTVRPRPRLYSTPCFCSFPQYFRSTRNREHLMPLRRRNRAGRSERDGGSSSQSTPTALHTALPGTGILENQSQRVELLGGMAAGMAHEFNNLLTIALGSLEQLRRQSLDERGHMQLERAEWSVRQAGRLAQQVLSFVRREAGELQHVDLNVIIGAFDKIMSHAAGDRIRFVLELYRMPLPVRLDPHQFELALLNLVRNATDAMSGSGAVTIRTVAHRSDGPEGQQTVEVSVSDTGSGMPPEIVERATTSFFTTKPRGKGTGLGLWMVKRFAAASGGKLGIDTEVGRGTTVRLVFPRARNALPTSPREPEPLRAR